MDRTLLISLVPAAEVIFDDEQRGLDVRGTASGGKAHLAQYTFPGRKRRIPLGSTSGVSLAKVRDAARAILGDVAKGIDPAAERERPAIEARVKAAHDAMTLAALLEDWTALHPAARRPSYAAEAVRTLRHAFGRARASSQRPAGARRKCNGEASHTTLVLSQQLLRAADVR